MGAILRLVLLSVLVSLFVGGARGLLCTSNSDCPRLYFDDDEHYCCGSSYYSYCCDFTSYLSDAFDDYDYYEDTGSWAVGAIVGVIFGVIGAVVLTVVCIVVCVCCVCNKGRGNTTTTVYHSQAAPVATVATSHTTTTASPYPTQPPPYVNFTNDQGGLMATKY